MNDFEGLLPTNLGFKPQKKSAPIASSKATSDLNSTSSLNFDLGSHGASRSTRTSHVSTGSFPDDSDSFFGSTGSKKSQDLGGLDDFLAGSSRFVNKSDSLGGGNSEFDFNSMFSQTGNSGRGAQPSDSPVFDKPVYDDDIFDGVPGLKSSSKVKYEDVFSSVTSPPRENAAAAFDEFFGGFGKSEPVLKSSSKGGARLGKDEKGDAPDFDDLIPGFGGSNPSLGRSASKPSWSSEPIVPKTTSKTVENSFEAPGHNADPFEEINKLSSSGSMKMDGSSAANDRVFADINPFSGLGKSAPPVSLETGNRGKVKSPPREDRSSTGPQTTTSKGTAKTSARSPERHWQKNASAENDWQSEQILFDMPTVSTNSHKSVPRSSSPPSYENSVSKYSDAQDNMSPESENNVESSEDIWLTVSEVPLFTLPTSAPPPSRPPPPIPVPNSRMGPSTSTNSRKKVHDYSSTNAKYFKGQVRDSVISQVDELEEFVMERNRSNGDESATGISNEDLEMNSAAAAMKEAMDTAEARFRQAKEVRGRDNAKTVRIKETMQPDKDETIVSDVERFQKEREEERRQHVRLEKERDGAREMERDREEKEREQKRRLEKERERVRELELEREKARQAVERATREARGRAATEARLKAERAAVQRAQAEARERAAAGAQVRAEKAATEARERASAEAKERAEAEARAKTERAAVQRAAAEARERAAADARERAAAAAARPNQQSSESDLESFFMAGRASSVPRPRANPVDPYFETQPQNRQESEAAKAPLGTSSSMRKASSTSNIVDDLSSIFGAPRSSGEFQDIEGETVDKRRARLERHQRTQERAAKALAEKNERDLQTQREQAERHRIAETLDVEIKRWAAGKEGNLRALLSTLQYVLWPECGWQPVSLTDLITGAAVKKGYRKATLCIHPDKVQQKGATLQQKYVAEKVFDILKEAWNKFNSEELF